jgi:hypothetical protein
MGSTKFSKRDKNRFRKVYPYLRVRPRNTYCADKEVIIEVGDIAFSNTDGPVTYTFTETFVSTPTVTAISVDSESNNTADVNIFIDSISTTQVQFSSSAAFTGKVHFQVIMVGT